VKLIAQTAEHRTQPGASKTRLEPIALSRAEREAKNIDAAKEKYLIFQYVTIILENATDPTGIDIMKLISTRRPPEPIVNDNGRGRAEAISATEIASEG
jgi:hypothetical protein